MSDYGPVIALVAVVVAAVGAALAFWRPWTRGFSANRVSNTLADLERAFDIEKDLRKQEGIRCDQRLMELRHEHDIRIATTNASLNQLKGRMEVMESEWADRIAERVADSLKEHFA